MPTAPAPAAEYDLSGFDGINLRVKGDGQTFKLNIKTVGGWASRWLGDCHCAHSLAALGWS